MFHQVLMEIFLTNSQKGEQVRQSNINDESENVNQHPHNSEKLPLCMEQLQKGCWL